MERMGKGPEGGLSSQSAGAPASPNGTAWVLLWVAERAVSTKTYNGRGHPEVELFRRVIAYAIGT